MPPRNCERAVRGLMIRPTANTPSMPRDADLAGVRRRPAPRRTARRRRGGRTARAPRGTSALSAKASLPALARAASRSAQADGRAPRGGAHRAARHGPRARQRAVADLHAAPARRRRSSASAAICVSTVRAPVPMSAAPISTRKLAVAAARSPSPWPGSGRPGRSRRPRPCRPASGRRGARPGVGSRPSQPKRCGALAQAGDEVARAERVAARGIDLGLVAHAQLDRVERQRDGQLVDRATPARTCPGTRRARGTTTASARRAREPVRRVAVGRGVHRARGQRGLLGELADRRALLGRLVADRRQPAVGGGPEPHALDRRRAVADEGEHLLARDRDLHRPLRGAWPPCRRRPRAGAACPWSRSRRRRAG